MDGQGEFGRVDVSLMLSIAKLLCLSCCTLRPFFIRWLVGCLEVGTFAGGCYA